MNTNLHAFSLILALAPAAALSGCLDGDDDGASDDGASDDGHGGSTSSSGSHETRTHVGLGRMFVVNPTDATVSLRDPYQDGDARYAWTVLPRQGRWLDVRLYGAACLDGAPSCGALAVEGIPGVTAYDYPADLHAELVLLLDRSSANFDQRDIPAPPEGKAALRYVGSGLFGTIEGGELVPLTAVTEVPDRVQVGFDDGDGGFVLLRDDGRPFVAGQRYFVNGKRTDPPSLLVCNLSQETPEPGCFDYQLAE